MSYSHEWISLVDTIYQHDKIMLGEEKKETMLEDICEVGTMNKSSSEKLQGH